MSHGLSGRSQFMAVQVADGTLPSTLTLPSYWHRLDGDVVLGSMSPTISSKMSSS